MSPVERLLSQLGGRTPWTGYDVLAVTGTSREAVDWRVSLLRHHLRRTPLRVLGVLDDRDRGNLHGTLDAWAVLRAALGDHERGAILHDAGRATRTAPITWFGDGSRGGLDLGARWSDEPVPWLALVALGLQAFARASTHVDVFWGSQLMVPTAPDGLEPPHAPLHKLARRAHGPVSSSDRQDLGWFGLTDDGDVAAFEAQGRFDTAEAFEAFRQRHGDVAADLGSASWSRTLLDALVPIARDLGEARLDVDPDLTQPWLARLAGGALPSALLDRLFDARPELAGPGSVEVQAIQLGWWRLRRPEEVQAILTDLARGDPTLRRLFGVRHPIERSLVGRRWIEGPEVTFAEMERGLTIDGVKLSQAVVLDSVLAEGSRLERAVSMAASGFVRLRDGAVVRSAGELDVRDGITWQLHPGVPTTVRGACAVSLTRDRILTRPHGSTAPEPTPVDTDGVWREARWWTHIPSVTHHPRLEPRLATLWRTLEATPTRSGELIEELMVPWGDALTVEAAEAARRVLAFGWSRRRDLPTAPRPLRSAGQVTPHHIAVLSRVSVGADVALVTPLLVRLRRRWPEARLTVIGGRLGDLLPAGAVPVELRFDRQSTLDARVDAWRAVDEVVRALAPDLVIGPASRLDQVGTLPVGDSPYAAVDLCRESHGSMTRRVNLWCDAWLGPGTQAVPTLSVPHELEVTAAAFDRRVDFSNRGGVALKLGVGGDLTKALPVADEITWLLHQLRQGPVLLDLGLGTAETARARTLVDAAANAGHTVADLGHATPRTQLVTWEGGLAEWAALVHHAKQALGYDSAQGHLAAADRQRGDLIVRGTPATVLFIADVPERFREAWTPSGNVPVRAITGGLKTVLEGS